MRQDELDLQDVSRRVVRDCELSLQRALIDKVSGMFEALSSLTLAKIGAEHGCRWERRAGILRAEPLMQRPKSTFHHKAMGRHVQGGANLIGVWPAYAATTR
jgi:hypothetical protein